MNAPWLLDLEMNLRLRQGRVEGAPGYSLDDVDAPLLDDFSDAVFLHRRLVECLNDEVKAKGGDKVDSLKKQAAGRLDIYKAGRG